MYDMIYCRKIKFYAVIKIILRYDRAKMLNLPTQDIDLIIHHAELRHLRSIFLLEYNREEL